MPQAELAGSCRRSCFTLPAPLDPLLHLRHYLFIRNLHNLSRGCPTWRARPHLHGLPWQLFVDDEWCICCHD